MPLEPALPGYEPAYVRIEITASRAEGRTVRVWAAQGVGFVTARESETYEHLTALEAQDVVAATLATLLGSPID